MTDSAMITSVLVVDEVAVNKAREGDIRTLDKLELLIGAGPVTLTVVVLVDPVPKVVTVRKAVPVLDAVMVENVLVTLILVVTAVKRVVTSVMVDNCEMVVVETAGVLTGTTVAVTVSCTVPMFDSVIVDVDNWETVVVEVSRVVCGRA